MKYENSFINQQQRFQMNISVCFLNHLGTVLMKVKKWFETDFKGIIHHHADKQLTYTTGH